jgi:hypothetical protein
VETVDGGVGGGAPQVAVADGGKVGRWMEFQNPPKDGLEGVFGVGVKAGDAPGGAVDRGRVAVAQLVMRARRFPYLLTR